MEKHAERKIFMFATLILIIAFLTARPTQEKTEQFILQQNAAVDLQLKQTPEKTELFLNVKCESLLKPMSAITGAFFNVDLCDN